MTLLNDIARCRGWGDGPKDWLEECHDCQRRTAPAGEQGMQPEARMAFRPPGIVALWCEAYIPPDRPEDQRLRELARRQGLGGEG